VTAIVIDAGYILAGGESRRFDGDKLVTLVDGVPAITRVVDALREAGAYRIFISTVTKRRCVLYTSLSGADGCIYDSSIGCQGPGRAILSILSHAEKAGFKSIVIVSGDMPWLSSHSIRRLHLMVPEMGGVAVPLHHGGFLESLFQAYKRPYPLGFGHLCRLRGKLRASDPLRMSAGSLVLAGSSLITPWNVEYAHINTREAVRVRSPKNKLGESLIILRGPMLELGKQDVCESLRSEVEIYREHDLHHLRRHAASDLKILCK